MHFALLSLSALLISLAGVATAVRPSPDAGNVFAVYPGWDMDNGGSATISRFINDTEYACLRSCSSSSTCVAYAYAPYGRGGTDVDPICVLKNALDITTFKMESFELSIGLVGACGTFNPSGPTRCFTVGA